MIGTKLYKNNKDDMAQYTTTAQWCNANDAHIEDRGKYYEVIENVMYEPTKEEKFAELDAQYNEEKDQLIKIYTDAVIHNDAELQQSIQEEMSELDIWYDEEYVRIKGE